MTVVRRRRVSCGHEGALNHTSFEVATKLRDSHDDRLVEVSCVRRVGKIGIANWRKLTKTDRDQYTTDLSSTEQVQSAQV
jgi:hypothetical protein